MTQALLQAFLVKDLKNFLKDCKYDNQSGVKTAVNVFYQDLPNDNKYEETAQVDYLPFVIVEIPDGTLASADEPHTVTVNFVIGTVDPTGSFDGYFDVFALINKILEYLCQKSSFNKKFMLNYPVKWSVKPDENAEPFYYGVVETSFIIPAISYYIKEQTHENTDNGDESA